MKKKIKKLPKQKKITAKEHQKNLAEIEKIFAPKAKEFIEANGEHKVLVIIQDNRGYGIARSTKGFTIPEFEFYLNQMKTRLTTDL